MTLDESKYDHPLVNNTDTHFSQEMNDFDL